jgi:hypothetical protein
MRDFRAGRFKRMKNERFQSCSFQRAGKRPDSLRLGFVLRATI